MLGKIDQVELWNAGNDHKIVRYFYGAIMVWIVKQVGNMHEKSILSQEE